MRRCLQCNEPIEAGDECPSGEPMHWWCATGDDNPEEKDLCDTLIFDIDRRK